MGLISGGAGSSGFNPASLFGSGEEGVILDFTRSSSSFQEITGASATSPMHNGVPIGTVLDLSPNGHYLVAPDVLLRPKWISAGCVEFNDTSQPLFLSKAYTANQPVVEIAAWTPIAGIGSDPVIMGGIDGNGAMFGANHPTYYIYAGNSLGTITVNTGDTVVTVKRLSGATSRVKRSDGSYVTGNAGTNALGGFSMGMHPEGFSRANMRVARVIQINRDLSDAEIDQAVAWCQQAINNGALSTNFPLITDGRPTASALRDAYVARSFGVMICFNMPTYINVQIGTGNEDPDLFNPTALSFNQWLDAIQDAGAQYVVPTAKHHDGFCWWPSDAQPHNVSQSAWYGSNGSPDLLADFYENAHGRGLTVIPYMSVWDRRFETDNPSRDYEAYAEHTKATMREIYDRCPGAAGVWTDGWAWNNTCNYAIVPPPPIWEQFYALWPNGVLAENNHQHNGLNTDIDISEEGGGDPDITVSGPPSERIETVYAESAGARWFWANDNTIAKSASDIMNQRDDMNALNAAYLISFGADPTGVLGTAELAVMGGIS